MNVQNTFLQMAVGWRLETDLHQAQIQALYQKHRTNRNAQQKSRLLAPDFPGVTVDGILAKLEAPSIESDFKDWRHCLVFWARPPAKVRTLIAEVQEKLRSVAPGKPASRLHCATCKGNAHTPGNIGLWTMPPPNLHMTALEITHSLTEPEIDELVKQMLVGVPDITDYTYTHRARLVKPVVSFDAQALALSFLPAAGEPGSSKEEDSYSYHHLRRDLFTKAQATGVKVASRYVVPSAHLTIGRFITSTDFETTDGKVNHAKLKAFIDKIEEINHLLEDEFWPKNGQIKDGGEWIVGEEKGLEYRKGTLWYGSGGETVHLGKGF